jgi:hypothetical protein
MVRNMANRKKRLLIILLPVLITGLILLPFILWQLELSKPVHGVILDKTVPKPTYREHKALMWVLNNLKYINKQTFQAFEYQMDYYGFFPLNNFNYSIKHLPSHLENVDFIYLADTYGVYNEDFYGENIRGERSRLIYGGAELREIEAIEEALKKGTLLIGEFNSFATPTGRDAGSRLENLFGVRWNGWIGRYFLDLDRNNDEVPIWMIKNYERQYNTQWTFKGPGFGFVNIDDTVFVLKQGEDVGVENIKIIFNEQALREFKVKNNARYYYWFDILEPLEGTEILGDYRIDITDKGKKVLNDFGLRETFPAVVRTQLPYRTYYFAGDFSDIKKVPSFWQVSYYNLLRADLSADMEGEQTYFFWNVYYPLIENILKKELK